jgi:hypothetical protein
VSLVNFNKAMRMSPTLLTGGVEIQSKENRVKVRMVTSWFQEEEVTICTFELSSLNWTN